MHPLSWVHGNPCAVLPSWWPNIYDFIGIWIFMGTMNKTLQHSLCVWQYVGIGGMDGKVYAWIRGHQNLIGLVLFEFQRSMLSCWLNLTKVQWIWKPINPERWSPLSSPLIMALIGMHLDRSAKGLYYWTSLGKTLPPTDPYSASFACI